MKLVTYIYEGIERIGVLTADGGKVCPIDGFSSMNELIEKADEKIMENIAETAAQEKNAVDFSEVTKRAPIPIISGA